MNSRSSSFGRNLKPLLISKQQCWQPRNAYWWVYQRNAQPADSADTITPVSVYSTLCLLRVPQKSIWPQWSENGQVEFQKFLVKVWNVFLRCFRACRLPSRFSNHRDLTHCDIFLVSQVRQQMRQIGKREMRQTQLRQCPLDLDFVHREGPKERIRPQLKLPKVRRKWLGRNWEILQMHEMPSWGVGRLFSKQYTWQIERVNQWPCQTSAQSANRADQTTSSVVVIDFVRQEGSNERIEMIRPWLRKLLQ